EDVVARGHVALEEPDAELGLRLGGRHAPQHGQAGGGTAGENRGFPEKLPTGDHPPVELFGEAPQARVHHGIQALLVARQLAVHAPVRLFDVLEDDLDLVGGGLADLHHRIGDRGGDLSLLLVGASRVPRDRDVGHGVLLSVRGSDYRSGPSAGQGSTTLGNSRASRLSNSGDRTQSAAGAGREGRRMTRRSLLQMLGLGAGVAIAAPARADRIRILPGMAAGDAPLGGEPVGTDLRRFLGSVRTGERRANGGLRVFWPAGPAAASFAVRTLDEARARGELQVTERDQATVSAL